MSANERTGWRDEEISLRHREWGYNCPAVDLDFLVVEYNLGEPVALVEYKHERAQPPNYRHPTYRAIHKLADMAGIPFMVVFYRREPWRFYVIPINERATSFYRRELSLSEVRYVRSLYVLRGRVVDAHVMSGLAEQEDAAESWRTQARVDLAA